MHSGQERKKKPTFEGKIDGQKVKGQTVFIPNYVVPVYMEVKLKLKKLNYTSSHLDHLPITHDYSSLLNEKRNNTFTICTQSTKKVFRMHLMTNKRSLLLLLFPALFTEFNNRGIQHFQINRN